MSSSDKLNHQYISKLAEDIRVIQDFTKNYNFDDSLLKNSGSTESKPPKKTKSIDITLGVITLAVILFLACVISNVFFGLQGKESTILLLITILFIGISCVATHIRFQNYVATTILAFALIAITAIGFEIYTVKEVIDKAVDSQT